MRSLMLRGRDAAVPDWQRALNASISSFQIPSPRFDLRVTSANSYDQLFDFRDDGSLGEDQLLEKALLGGRVLVGGRGGGGKTVFLQRCAKRCILRGFLPIFLPLKVFTQKDASLWLELRSRLTKIDFMLRTLSKPQMGIAELDGLAPSISRVILVDGLNEVEGRVAQELIFCLDEYAGTAINTSIMVTDRLVRREFISADRWSLYAIRPLSSTEILGHTESLKSSITEDQRELLSSPYFLDLFLANGTLKSSSASEMEEWFTKHALNLEDLPRASAASFAVYGHSSRSFPLIEFEKVAGGEIGQKLIAAGALTVRGSDALFDHHLKHDFLASRHLANNPSLWSGANYDRVTFASSSFDSIMMCLEQVSREDADRFIRTVYDWNLYGVGYALSESKHHNVSEEMRHVMIAMFAERLWDLIEPTARKARDTLKLLRNDSDSQQFLRMETRDQALSRIRDSWDGPSWFKQWKAVFTTPVGSGVDDDLTRLLEEEDSVLGWTTSNVLRRCNLSEKQQEHLRRLIDTGAPVVRWRAVHTLGAFPSHSNVPALAAAVRNEDRLVRYGGVRSCFESASQASEPIRSEIFEMLQQNGDFLSEHSSLKDEMRRAMLIPKAMRPQSWVQYCIRLITGWQPSETPAEREKWTRTAQALLDLRFLEDQASYEREKHVHTI